MNSVSPLAAHLLRKATLLLDADAAFEAAALVNEAVAHDPEAAKAAAALLTGPNAALLADALVDGGAIVPTSPQHHWLLGISALALNRPDEAADHLAEAARQADAPSTVFLDLSAALNSARRWGDAEQAARNALRHLPEDAVAWYNLGYALNAQFRLDEALAAYRRSVELDPHLASAWVTLGNILLGRGETNAGLAALNQAVAADPEAALPRWNQALAQLSVGRLAEGFAGYETRFRVVPGLHPPPGQPWDGGEVQGLTLLLAEEQGYGDTLHMLRYLPLLKQRGARILLAVRPALHRLLNGWDGIDALLEPGPPWPQADRACPLLSLPRLFGTTLDTIPAAPTYLPVPPPAAAVRDLPGQGPVVGLIWRGRTQRTCTLDDLAPITRLTGIRLASLQFGLQPGEADQLAALGIADLGSTITDFHDLAEHLMGVDLLVTIDSAPAHLAGALGRPTVLLLRHAPDWRWLLGRSDSPWYPSLTLCREDHPGDWASAVAKAAHEVKTRLLT